MSFLEWCWAEAKTGANAVDEGVRALYTGERWYHFLLGLVLAVVAAPVLLGALIWLLAWTVRLVLWLPWPDLAALE